MFTERVETMNGTYVDLAAADGPEGDFSNIKPCKLAMKYVSTA